MNKRKEKFISVFLILVVMFGICPVVAQTKGDLSNPQNQIGSIEQDGGIKLTKTLSTVDADKGIYNVKIDIESKNSTTTNTTNNPLYIVVVFDTSGSMCEPFKLNCGDKWKNALDGAKTFSTTLLDKIPEANIALINFASGASIKRTFNNIALTDNDFNSPKGGTNVAKGLSEAKTLLANIQEPNAQKYVVLMSDGEPQVYTSIIRDNKAIEEATVAALEIKDEKIELYAVGYDTTIENANFLKQIVTTPDTKYYASGSVDNIVTTFNNIVEEISTFPAGSDAIVTDVLPDNFSYVEDTKSQGVEVNNKTITYHIDELTETKESFTFDIAIDPTSKTGWHDTNKQTFITYTDFLGEKQQIDLTKFSKVYWEIIKYDYTINYYQDTVETNNLLDRVKSQADYNSEIAINTNYKKPNGYQYTGELTSLVVDKDNKTIDIIYTKKNNLSYCVQYYYDGIVDLNSTECYDNQTYGEKITSFINKPRDGYVFDDFDPIELTDEEENIMNVYYKQIEQGEIIPPKTGVNESYLTTILAVPQLLLTGLYVITKIGL